MSMMNFAVVLAGRMLMARSANLIAGVLELRAMRIVAVSAADVLMKHLAFEKRSVLIHLVHDLPVGVISRRGEHLVREIIVIIAAGGIAWRDYPPSRVAWGTGLDLRHIA